MGCGTIFKLDTNNSETILYNFSYGISGNGPVFPVGVHLIHGSLYGATSEGGSSRKCRGRFQAYEVDNLTALPVLPWARGERIPGRKVIPKASNGPRVSVICPEEGSEIWSGRRDLNPRLRPWQGRTLPLSYSRSLRNVDYKQAPCRRQTLVPQPYGAKTGKPG